MESSESTNTKGIIVVSIKKRRAKYGLSSPMLHGLPAKDAGIAEAEVDVYCWAVTQHLAGDHITKWGVAGGRRLG